MPKKITGKYLKRHYRGCGLLLVVHEDDLKWMLCLVGLTVGGVVLGLFL